MFQNLALNKHILIINYFFDNYAFDFTTIKWIYNFDFKFKQHEMSLFCFEIFTYYRANISVDKIKT